MIAITLVGYPLSTCAFYCVFALVPKRRVPLLTRAGHMSIYVYLLHPLILFDAPLLVLLAEALAPLGCGAPSGGASTGARLGGFGGGLLEWAIYLSLVLGVWAALARPCVRWLCSPCVEPPLQSCCSERTAAAVGSAAAVVAPLERHCEGGESGDAHVTEAQRPPPLQTGDVDHRIVDCHSS